VAPLRLLHAPAIGVVAALSGDIGNYLRPF
jgi:hypothetical protein